MSHTKPTPNPGGQIAQLFERLRPRMHRIVLRNHRVPPIDAEDILHDTLALLMAKWETIHSPKAWLIATLSSRCRMYWRARHGTPGRFLVFMDAHKLAHVAGVSPAPTSPTVLRLALRELPSVLSPREVELVLGHAAGDTYEDLRTGVTFFTVQGALPRARRRLRAALLRRLE